MIHLENKITKIEFQQKRKDRVNVYINNEYGFSCSEELIFLHSLKKDMSIDIDNLSHIIDEEDYIKCKNDALRAVEKSYKTEKEIINKLIEKGYSDKNINRVIRFLKEYDFINDCKYVELYVDEKIKKRGRKRIKYELLKKGIEENIINDKLDNISYEYESSIIKVLAEKKYSILIDKENNSFKIYNKLFNYFSRLGYNSCMIKSILRNIIGDISLEDKDINHMAISTRRIKGSLHDIAEKKYNLLLKNEKNPTKIYPKLWRFLVAKGYDIDSVKEEIKALME